jgi:predicted permease
MVTLPAPSPMISDLKVAVRGFVRTPGFTATALVTLALCLGANLTIFAVIDSVLLRPLPFPAADRLVTIFNTYPKAGVDRDGSSVANYYERRGSIAAFSRVSLFRYGTVIAGEPGTTERADVVRATPEFFATLGVSPALGREFREEETTPGANGVVIITDGYWRARFNADPNVLGRSIRLDGVQGQIVGVLPPGFRFLSSEAPLFLPLSSDAGQRVSRQRHSGSNSEMVARLKPGVSLATAQAEIDAQNALLERNDPDAKMMADAGFRSRVVPLHADHVASVKPVLVLLQAGSLLLVLIGGVNLVNLLLIRASGRAREQAIRRSVGATSRHLITQVMVETLALTLVGAALGIAVGAGGVRLFGLLGVAQLPLGAYVEFDARLALITLVGATLLGVVIAAPIAWFNLRGQVAGALGSESRGGTSGRAVQRLRQGFIIAQVSLAFVLLAGSGLLAVSLKRAMAVSPGFRPDHVLTGHLSLPRKNYTDLPALLAFTDRLTDAVGTQPGVTAVGAITNIPLSGMTLKSAITVRGHVLRPGESPRGHYTYGVTGDYFAALGIPLREGRFLTAADAHRDARLCVVDEDFARRYWPGGGAIGQQLFQGGGEGRSDEAFTVVGVVGAVRQAAVTETQAQGAVYFPYTFRGDRSIFVAIRTVGQPDAFAAGLGRIVRAMDPELPVDGLRSMDVRISDSLIARRSPALLAGIFACVALLLAAVGTYGVLSYAVVQRKREIGVRLALGAQPEQIGSQFLAIGLRLLAAGTILGIIGAWMAGRLMQNVLFEVPALHVATLTAAAAIIGVVSLVACMIPARRAARVDPLTALSAD